jgi:hypothetical protein
MFRVLAMVVIAGCSSPAPSRLVVEPVPKIEGDHGVAIARDDVVQLLYGERTPPDCGDVECLIEHRYRDDPKAKAAALALFRATGDIAGVGRDEIMDGGYRGKIHLVPELPILRRRQHLDWVSGAMTEIDGFFSAQFDGHPAPKYRWRALGFRFVRSVNKRTPSAYAAIAGRLWFVEYNVEGSLLISAGGVRETLFHELFHLNDEDHGDWSARHLATDYAAIVAKCGTNVSCLAPYAPNDTMVRGGTYYAFQQNNGEAVHEYAAELAVRYFKEQSEMRAKGRLSHKAFKCGPEPNARVWKLFIAEFFAGRDLVPAC